jgi:non-ribosomal peptide synthetase component E (peptide arylation enzyme)
VTFPEPPEQFNLADYFLAVGAGDQAAVVTDERTYSYDEVRERVNQAANLLHGLGLQPEQRVLLAFPDGNGVRLRAVWHSEGRRRGGNGQPGTEQR